MQCDMSHFRIGTIFVPHLLISRSLNLLTSDPVTPPRFPRVSARLPTTLLSLPAPRSSSLLFGWVGGRGEPVTNGDSPIHSLVHLARAPPCRSSMRVHPQAASYPDSSGPLGVRVHGLESRVPTYLASTPSCTLSIRNRR